jgi:hypothetical protein
MTKHTIVILNFGHPFTETQLAEMTEHLDQGYEVQDIRMQIDRKRPLVDLIKEIVDGIGLTSEEWQTHPLVMNPPGLAPLALGLIAEIHGRCGYFLPMVHIRPVDGAMPPRYEVAEIVNLQSLREEARTRR